MSKLNDAVKSGAVKSSKKFDAIEAELDKLGKITVKGKQIEWDPPADLEPYLARMIKASVKALAKKVEKGEVTVDANGDVHAR